MALPTHATIADYEAACPPQGRAALTVVREIIEAALPVGAAAEERLSYALPTLFVGGKRVVHFAGWAEHLAMYPIPPAPHADPHLREDLTPFMKGKGTLHFPYAAGLPTALIARVVRAHLVRIGLDPR